MTLSIIIPVYECNDHLDICLLSILGQVQIKDMEVICVPVMLSSQESQLTSMSRLETWQRRDDRIVLTSHAHRLYDALRKGVETSSGTYIMFVNQTDIVISAQNLTSALNVAEEREVQVLLVPKQRRSGITAFSTPCTFEFDRKLLPEGEEKVFSVKGVGGEALFIDIPLPYGNIYKRRFLASLFQSEQAFGNAGDVIFSQISMLRAERISYTEVPVVESRYEDCVLPLLMSEELSMAERVLSVQTTLVLASLEGKMIARNVIIRYLAYLISSYHPYGRFLEAVEHYRSIFLSMADVTRHDALPQFFSYWNYLHTIATAAGDNLIEAYTVNPFRTIPDYE